jgi:hypothetical protein
MDTLDTPTNRQSLTAHMHRFAHHKVTPSCTPQNNTDPGHAKPCSTHNPLTLEDPGSPCAACALLLQTSPVARPARCARPVCVVL